MSYQNKKILPALLPKPSHASLKRKQSQDDSIATITTKKSKQEQSSITGGKKILAVTSDPNSYKIPEHLLSSDQPKPRILKSCTRCRKHKTKCNYIQTAPHSCQSCCKKNLTCQFEIVIPTKRSNLIKSLNESIIDLRKMVDGLISHEKKLKNICSSRGITVDGLVDVEKLSFDCMYKEDSFEEYEDEDEEDEDEEEDDDEDDDSVAPTLLGSNGMTTPITSPHTTPQDTNYTHDFKELIIINNDNTPIMASSIDDEQFPIGEELILNPPVLNARPTKVTYC